MQDSKRQDIQTSSGRRVGKTYQRLAALLLAQIVAGSPRGHLDRICRSAFCL